LIRQSFDGARDGVLGVAGMVDVVVGPNPPPPLLGMICQTP